MSRETIQKKSTLVKKIKKTVKKKSILKKVIVHKKKKESKKELEKSQKSQKKIYPKKNQKSSKSKPEPKKEKIQTKEEQYMQNHLQEIATLIQDNLYYPRRARKRGITGKVIVTFHLSKEGEVSLLRVLFSPNAILSRAAIKSIEEISLLLPKPEENITLTIPIVYKLN